MGALTYERAHELLRLDEETGRLYWKKRAPRSKIKTGNLAGTFDKSTGYLYINVDGRRYLQHRVVFLMVHGYFPEHEVDHINGIRGDNRPENLRESSRVCNLQNRRAPKNNTTGFPNVSRCPKTEKYRATMRVHGDSLFLGLHPTKLEAALAAYTCKVWDCRVSCDSQGALVKAIQRAWPEFKPTEG